MYKKCIYILFNGVGIKLRGMKIDYFWFFKICYGWGILG